MTDRADFVPAGSHAEVAVVVVTYNSADHLPELLADLRRDARERTVRLIVVDNDSADDSVAIAEREPDAVVVRSGGNLGYSGGVNRARHHFGSCDAVLIINPDLRLRPGAIDTMLATLRHSRVGAVVPLMVDEQGEVFHSLNNEPSMMRSLGDLVFGPLWSNRPAALSESVRGAGSYGSRHAVDWATGAAVMIRSEVDARVGEWDERYFLYSEETDYCRRIRDHGYTVMFEPAAIVEHIGGGSGTSPALTALMAVNKVRYVEKYHGGAYTTLFRVVVLLTALRRSRDPAHRGSVGFLADRGTWSELPTATAPAHVSLEGGAVIIPAHNEASVIARTLAPLSAAAAHGGTELIVVCNGCSDDTAEVARAVRGVTVIEIETPSKIAALNTGDEAAYAWPRMYLDADIAIAPAAVAQVFAELRSGHVLAARPTSRYDTTGATSPVRRYYRARRRIPHFKEALWGAGAYALNEEGHRRVGRFPDVTADDLWIDEQFSSSEKKVVVTQPTLVSTPRDSRSLVNTLRRVYRGSSQLPSDDSAGRSLRSLLNGVRGPRTAADALVYSAFAIAARRTSRRQSARWERDDSSRVQR